MLNNAQLHLGPLNTVKSFLSDHSLEKTDIFCSLCRSKLIIVVLTGKNHLDKELVHFTSEAKEIRDCYRSAFINKTDNPKKIIFVTGSEREESESVVNCTKAEIERNILLKIEKMPANEGKLMEELYKKTVKRKGKNAYIDFYYTLLEDEQN